MTRPIDYDDDDYFPPASGDAKPRKSSGWLIAGLVLGAFVIVGVGLYLVRTNRQAAMNLRQQMQADETARMRQAALQAAPPVGEEPFPAPGVNWPKVIGTWERQPTGPGDTTYPHRFEFHRKLNAQVTWQRPDGSSDVRNFEVTVQKDQEDQITIRFRVPSEAMIYQFTLTSDRTLVLRGPELVFSRP